MYKAIAIGVLCGAALTVSSCGGPVNWSKFRSNLSNNGIAAPSNAQGKLLWSVHTGGLINSSPAIGPDGTVYIGSTDGFLYAVDSAGSQKWKFQTGDEVNSSPAVYNGVVYFGSKDKKVYAVGAATGQKVWEFATGDEVYSSPAPTSTLVYVGSNDGNLYALDTATGKKKWSVKADGAVQSPALPPLGGLFFTSLNSKVYRVNETTGAVTWQAETGQGQNISSPAIGVDGTVYVPSNDGTLYAFDGATGTPSWTLGTGHAVTNSSSAAVIYWGTPTNDRIFFGNGNGFFAADAGTHAFIWRNPPWQGSVSSSPAVVRQGVLYVGVVNIGDNSVSLVAADAATGATKWVFSGGTGYYSSPAIGVDGKVYVGNLDGNLYAIQ